MFSHWFLNSSMLAVRSMACQTNAECILRFSNILDGTSSALNQVHHVAGSTVCGGSHTKSCTSCSAAKHGACFYMRTCLTASMFTRTNPLVCLSLLHERRPDQKVPQIRRETVCYKGTLRKCFFQTGGYVKDTLMVMENTRQVGKIWVERDY